MSDGTAQTFRFTDTTDQGKTFGPFGRLRVGSFGRLRAGPFGRLRAGSFDLPDADHTYTAPADFIAHRLRFDVEESSGGNTGAVEIEVYGTLQE